MLIGKSVNPCCFKNINKKALPVQYCAQTNAWIDSPIFSNWFHNQFVPAVSKYQKERGLTVKALLLLYNAPSHPDVSTLVSQDGNIKCMYLPPNTTALFQPMDQGVLEAMKRRYRKALLQKLLLEDQEGRSIIQFVKKINMKDVVYMAATAPLQQSRGTSSCVLGAQLSNQCRQPSQKKTVMKCWNLPSS